MSRSFMTSPLIATKILAGLAVAGLLITGCSNPSAKSPNDAASGSLAGSTEEPLKVDPALQAMLPEKIKSAGTLKVATDPTYPPFEFYDTDNKTIIGADPELAQALGQILGIKFQLEAASFANIIPSLASGKYDVAMSGMADRTEREKVVTFVTYMRNAGAFLVPAASKFKPMSLDDLCGLNVAVQSGTTMADDISAQVPVCLNTGKKAVSVLNFKSQDEIVLALNSRRADVSVVTSGSGAYIVHESGTAFEMTATYDAGSILGIAVNNGNKQLVDAIRGAMQKLITDGTYKRILTKWGLFKLNSVSESVINGAAS